MKKKSLAFLLGLIMVLLLVGCGKMEKTAEIENLPDEISDNSHEVKPETEAKIETTPNEKPQIYYEKSEKLIADGKVLSGETVENSEEIFLIENGDEITFHYFGKDYVGHRKSAGSQIVIWGDEPKTFADGVLMMTSLLELLVSDQFVGYDLNLDYFCGSIDVVHQIELRKE